MNVGRGSLAYAVINDFDEKPSNNASVIMGIGAKGDKAAMFDYIKDKNISLADASTWYAAGVRRAIKTQNQVQYRNKSLRSAIK